MANHPAFPTSRTCEVCGKSSPGDILSYRYEKEVGEHRVTVRIWAHRPCLVKFLSKIGGK